MLRLAQTKECISVVNDQIGCPTLAADLAALIMCVVEQAHTFHQMETFHFSNRGRISWYDFACEIMRLAQLHHCAHCPILPITTDQYPTPATRPNFSLFDLSKTADKLHFNIPDWQNSLERVFPQIACQFSSTK